jgi:hypothetical protein
MGVVTWLRRLFSARERRLARAGKLISALLLLVQAAGDHRVRADFLALTLQQRQQYLASLLRGAGLEDEAAAVEALHWQVPLAPATLSKFYLSVESAAEEAIGAARQVEKRRAATAAFVDAAMSCKHAALMNKKTWGAHILTPDASHQVLREASAAVLSVIRLSRDSGLLERDEADRRMESVLSQQAGWVSAGFGRVPKGG